VGWFAAAAVPLAVAGAVLLAHAPVVEPAQRLLGVFLLGVVVWRSSGSAQRPGSARRCWGSVGPLTAPFFLAYGLTARPTSAPRPPSR
jgi:hypothetical protein